MQETNLTAKTIYRPIPFLLSVFSITWLCAFLMTIADYNAPPFSSRFWTFWKTLLR